MVTPQRLDAHRLIEEFMIQANVAAAETLERRAQPLIYRVHDEPSLEKMQALREFLATIGITLPKARRAAAGAVQPHPRRGVRGPRHRAARQRGGAAQPGAGRIRRRELRPFRPQPAPLRPFHLADPPLRRPDRAPRADPRAASSATTGLPDDIDARALGEDRARSISAAERRAMAAERETIDRLIAHFLADRVGATFEGHIAGVTRAGLFVKLDETGADGFVPAATLGDDYFRYDEAATRSWASRAARRIGSATGSRCASSRRRRSRARCVSSCLSEGSYEAGKRAAPRFKRPAGRSQAGRGARTASRARDDADA